MAELLDVAFEPAALIPLECFEGKQVEQAGEKQEEPGLPDKKDALATRAYAKDAIVQKAVPGSRKRYRRSR